MLITMIFILVGIMNPAVAKLTPWLLETMADSLAESGMSVTVSSVSALDSWAQFYKNIPMALIAFILLQSGIFTKEYSSGTLVLSLTKGLERFKVVIAKELVLTALWTVEYWLCFGITYAYNSYFWNNAVAHSLFFSAVCWWIFGILTSSLTVFFSTVLRSNTGVLIATGAAVTVSSLSGLLPRVGKYLPTLLTDGNSLIYGASKPRDYFTSLVITLTLCVLCFIASIPIFNKKQL